MTLLCRRLCGDTVIGLRDPELVERVASLQGGPMTDPAGLALDELKSRRRELQQLDDAISYVRRVAQGRADLARAEQVRRRSGDAPQLTEDLPHVLGDRLLGESGRPPRPAEDFSEDPRSAALDRLCADHGYGRLDELEDTALADLAAALDEFEVLVSSERREVFAELDELTDELVRRYREQSGGADQLEMEER